jgi:hypothetical protein
MRASEFTTEAVFDSNPSINAGPGKIAQTPGTKAAQPQSPEIIGRNKALTSLGIDPAQYDKQLANSQPNQQVGQNTSNQVGTTGVTNNTVVKPGVEQNSRQQQVDQQKQSALLKNLQQLKTAAPGINVQKDVTALSKDPSQQTPQDKQNLANIATQLGPVLKNPSGVQSLKQLISKMQALDTKQQDLEKKNQAAPSNQVQPQANKS